MKSWLHMCLSIVLGGRGREERSFHVDFRETDGLALLNSYAHCLLLRDCLGSLANIAVASEEDLLECR
jgi:hypothetical protein